MDSLSIVGTSMGAADAASTQLKSAAAAPANPTDALRNPDGAATSSSDPPGALGAPRWPPAQRTRVTGCATGIKSDVLPELRPPRGATRPYTREPICKA